MMVLVAVDSLGSLLSPCFSGGLDLADGLFAACWVLLVKAGGVSTNTEAEGTAVSPGGPHGEEVLVSRFSGTSSVDLAIRTGDVMHVGTRSCSPDVVPCGAAALGEVG